MKQVFLLLFIFIFASSSFAQETENEKKSDEKERKVILHVNSYDLAVQNADPQVQVQVEVEAEEYPGLNVDFENPANSLKNYKPYTKQELQAYSDLLLDYQLTDYDRSETARPHKPARIFRTSIPD